MKRPLLLMIFWMLCQPTVAQEPKVTVPGLDALGITFQPKAPVPESFPEKIIELLFPTAEWKAEGLSFASGPARAYQFNYARGGGIITVDRLGPRKCLVSIMIERPRSARIRHYVMIGTDLAAWEIIRRDPPSPDGEPFARTYLLRLTRHPIISSTELRGIVFYDGTWVELRCGSLERFEATRDSMLRLTWNLAQRLREAYGQHIAPIAKSLDDGAAEVTRPDLPDADTRPDQPTRTPKVPEPLGD
jgi:hypothetical protein